MKESDAFGPIDRAKLMELAEAPIDNAERANRKWVPMGLRRAPRQGKRGVDKGELQAARDYEHKQTSTKWNTLLEYYARTDKSLAEIAALLGVKNTAWLESDLKERGWKPAA